MRREKIKKTISGDQFDFGSVQSISEWTFALPTTCTYTARLRLGFRQQPCIPFTFYTSQAVLSAYFVSSTLPPIPLRSRSRLPKIAGDFSYVRCPAFLSVFAPFTPLYFLCWYCCQWDWLAPFPTALDFFERVLMKIDMAGTCAH